MAIWAIPQAALRGLEHEYNIASACDDPDHQALVQQNLDVKVSTRATQSSLDSLTTNFKTAYADYGKAYRGAAAYAEPHQ